MKQADFAGFAPQLVIEVVTRVHGPAAGAKVAALAAVPLRTPAWCRWQDLDAAFVALETVIPEHDIPTLAKAWHHGSLRTVPLVGLLRSGASPAWIYRRAPAIIRLFAPGLAVETVERRRGFLVEFDYRIRYPAAWSPRLRRWIKAVIGHSHTYLPSQSPLIHGVTVDELPAPADETHWRLRWHTKPSYSGIAVAVLLAVVLVLILPDAWDLAAAGAGAVLGWWLGRRRPHLDAAIVGDLLRLSDHQNEADLNLTERRQRLTGLERRHQTGLVAARLIHELSNPLTAIGMASQALREDPHDLEAQALLHQAVERAERIIRAVRSAHAVTPPPQVRLRAAGILVVIDIVAAGLCEQGTVEVVRPPPEAEVEVADGAIEIVVANLLRNAHQAAETARPLRIRCWCEVESQELLHLYVRDNGRGMEPHTAAAAMAGHSATPDGLGLGLALCRDLCAQSGGQFRLHETLPGRGTTFRITLPVSSPATAAAQAAPLP